MKIGIAVAVVVILAAVGFYAVQSGTFGAESPAPAPAPAPSAAVTPEPTMDMNTHPAPSSTPSPAPVSAPAPKPTTPAPVPSPAAPASVSISGFAFTPAELHVKKGTKVTWTNLELSGHTITSDSGVFASGNISQGKTFSFTFNTAGTFTYHCALHPSMTGKVIVE